MNSALWPINPNFPRPFVFPKISSPEWLAFSFGESTKGDASKLIDSDLCAIPDWQWIWENIWLGNATDAQLLRLNPPQKPGFLPANRGGWAEMLLDPDAFRRDINGWALECASTEFDELNAGTAEVLDSQVEQRCRRFHAYQQARYHFHQHMLEKHCERAMGKAANRNPTTPAEARACFIGWLSKQRPFSKHRLVRAFRRAMQRKRKPLTLGEKRLFHAEQQFPSSRPWRSNPHEVAWLILTSPIWNFYDWRWVDIAYAVRLKFRATDGKGQSLDFQKENRVRLRDEMQSLLDLTGELPAAVFNDLLGRHIVETEDETYWFRRRGSDDDRAIEQRCRRLGLGAAEPRPKGRPQSSLQTLPVLWDFALRISV